MANERPLLPLALLAAAFGGATLLLLIGVATKSGAYVPDASAPPEPPEASDLDAIPLATPTLDATANPTASASASATTAATSTVTITAEDAGGDASHDAGKRKPHHR